MPTETTPPSIINPITAAPSTPTLAERKASFGSQVIQAVNQHFAQRVQNVLMIYNAMFGPSELSVTQRVSALGDRAVSLLQLFNAEKAALNAIAPGTVTLTLPQGYTFTPNADGTVDTAEVTE